MIELQNSVFYHAPKTGGSWVHEVLMENCNVVRDIGGHRSEQELPKNGKTAFAFVRHPLGIYESSYHYDNKRISDDAEWALSRESYNKFKTYIENMVSKYPGWLSKWAKDFYENIDLIGKQENLLEDLISFLDIALESYDGSEIRVHQKVNTTEYISVYTEYTKGLILQSEAEYIERFYSEESPDC
jgi:hypothetical protein